MKVVRFNDPNRYYLKAKPYLLEHEGTNCLILGISNGLCHAATQNANLPYLAVVEHNKTVEATAIQTPPRKLILAKSHNLTAIKLIAQDFATDAQSLPGVIAPKAEARTFVNTWQRLTGQTSQLDFAMALHQLEQTKTVNNASGCLKIAGASDAVGYASQIAIY